MRYSIAAVALAGTLVFTATAARADAIDGKWCNGAASITIDGPTITLPSGNRHQGDYTRHTFDFVVPENEGDAGDRLAMVVQSDELMHLRRTAKGSKDAGPVEPWRRCANIS